VERDNSVRRELESALSDERERRYVLRLYVSGVSPKSSEAIKNIKTICDEYLMDRHRLEVVDIYQQPRLAADAQVVAAPMLVRQSPLPIRRLIGNLSNTSHVLQALGLVT
jgi:circadian clock protein KaiB